MCFKLLRSTSCALIHLGNLLQDLHCVIHISDALTPAPTPHFNLLKHSRGNHLLWFLVSGTFQDPFFPSLPSTTLQANHNADSDNTGQSLCRFSQNTAAKRAKDNNYNQRVALIYKYFLFYHIKGFLGREGGNLTNPTGRCQTRPAGCCPSGPGCDQGLAMDQCGGPGRAECQCGSQRLPSWGPGGSPGRRLLGRPGRLHLNGEIKDWWVRGRDYL